MVPAATSPVTSMRSRVARNWAIEALALTTVPPRPVSDTQGGATGGGLWPPLPLPEAKPTAPSFRGPVRESVTCWERLHAPSPRAAAIAIVASRQYDALRVGSIMGETSGEREGKVGGT